MLFSVEIVNGGDVDVYLADEGIVGLMGKHILEGRELPIFFYGQHYLGALEAYLAALSFALFGPSLLALRFVTFLVSIGVLGAVYVFAKRVFSLDAARVATAITAIAPMYFLQWNLKARGGFVEHIVFVFIIMILFWRFYFDEERDGKLAVRLGLIAGIAFWVNQLVLAYLLFFAALLSWNFSDRRGWKPLIAAFGLGASLLLAYNVVNPGATVKSLGRKAVVLNRVPVEERDDNWLGRGMMKRIEALRHGGDKLAMVFGVPPRAGVERLGLSTTARASGAITTIRTFGAIVPLLLFGVAVAAGIFGRRSPATHSRSHPLSSEQVLSCCFLVTVLVGYVSPRYMLPAYPLAAVLVGSAFVRTTRLLHRQLLTAGIVGVFAFNVLSWVDLARASGTGDRGRIEHLSSALAEHGFDACLSAGPLYHVVFATKESVTIAPLQKDRYPSYGDVVDASEDICYVFRDDQRSKRQHVAFMKLLSDKRIEHEQFSVEPYTVLHNFRPRSAITPADLEAVRHQEKAKVVR